MVGGSKVRGIAALVVVAASMLVGAGVAAADVVDTTTTTVVPTTTTSTTTSSTSTSTTTTTVPTSSTTSSSVPSSTTTTAMVTTTTDATTTTGGFWGGPLMSEGDSCTEPGFVAHSARGEKLVCHIIEGSASVLGSSVSVPQTPSYTGGPLAVDGQFCKKALLGTLGHSSSNQALICAWGNNTTTPQWRLATQSEISSAGTTPKVLSATETKADGQLPLTGSRGMGMAVVAALVLGLGVIIRSRAAKKVDDIEWRQRRDDPARPTWKPYEPDDRWHW